MNDLSPLKFSCGRKVVAVFLYLYAVGSCYAQQVAEREDDAQKKPTVHDAASLLSREPSKMHDAVIASPATSQTVDQEDQAYDPQNGAITAAVADGVTTGLALSAGAVEMNPLISTTPLGVLALTGMKVGLVKYADTFPEQEKRSTLKTTSAMWGGAAVNNIMVLMAAPPPLPIVAGLIAGFAAWAHMDEQYRKEDERIAALARRKQEIAAHNGAVVAHDVETSGN